MSKRGYLILIYTGGNRKRGIVKILLMKKRKKKVDIIVQSRFGWFKG